MCAPSPTFPLGRRLATPKLLAALLRALLVSLALLLAFSQFSAGLGDGDAGRTWASQPPNFATRASGHGVIQGRGHSPAAIATRGEMS